MPTIDCEFSCLITEAFNVSLFTSMLRAYISFNLELGNSLSTMALRGKTPEYNEIG